MTTHTEPYANANEYMVVRFQGGHPQLDPPGVETDRLVIIEDWWDLLTGKSWGMSDGNPAALVYGIRTGMNQMPFDDEVVYGKDMNNRGHLIHTSELRPLNADERKELEQAQARGLVR